MLMASVLLLFVSLVACSLDDAVMYPATAPTLMYDLPMTIRRLPLLMNTLVGVATARLASWAPFRMETNPTTPTLSLFPLHY
ncbi:hypothetical protein EV401DRAFT_2033133 [Pisolithus croceorrhizus]|nr:hypothetical protein EV401DRAFT_2033133 [Pisolithus croceorrhizus]